MTDPTMVATDTAQAPAEATPKPTKAETEGSAAPAPSAAKDVQKLSKPTASAKRQTKASKVEALLARKSGATLDQIVEATDWQPHTCRAFMSGLRKKGREIVRETGKAGKSIYRFGAAIAATKAG